MKLIVTHHNPDLDAIYASWLLVRFLGQEFEEYSFAFVPAGETYKGDPVDSDPDVVHVDTGLGMFDHHDKEREHLSAGELVHRHVSSKQPHLKKDSALEHMTSFVTDIDHFGEYYWPDPLNTRYAFMLSSMIPSLHSLNKYSNEEVVEMGFAMLDSAYITLKEFESSKDDIEGGVKFESSWGKGIAIESGADGVMKIAQKSGYDVVVRRDPRTGFMKIKSAPKEQIDLKPLYDRIVAEDDPLNWYFHPSGHMLINGSSKNTDFEPTSLTIDRVVQIIAEIKQK